MLLPKNIYTAAVISLACLSLFSASDLYGHDSAYHKIEKLTQQLVNTPGNTQLYLQRAEEYQSVAEWEKALLDFRHIAKIDPEFKDLHYFRGLTLYRAGRYKEAHRELNRHLKRSPGNSAGRIARARILTELKLHQQAHEDYTKAITLLEIPPATLYIERSLALAEGGQTFLTEAIQGLDEAIRRFGPMVVLETPAIELELSRKNFPAALQRLDNILRQVARKEKWLARRGEILEKSGQLNLARSAYEAALKETEQLPEHSLRTPAMQSLRSHLSIQLNKLADSRPLQKTPPSREND